MNTSIKSIGLRDLFVIEKEKSACYAANFMTKHKIDYLVVVEENPVVYHAVGLLTPELLVEKIIAAAKNSKITPLKDIMNKDLFFIQETDSIETALIMMIKNKIRHILIIDEAHRLTGIADINHIILFLLKETNLAAEAILSQMPAHFNY